MTYSNKHIHNMIAHFLELADGDMRAVEEAIAKAMIKNKNKDSITPADVENYLPKKEVSEKKVA